MVKKKFCGGIRSCNFCGRGVRNDKTTPVVIVTGETRFLCPGCIEEMKAAAQAELDAIPDRIDRYRVLARIDCRGPVGFVGFVYG